MNDKERKYFNLLVTTKMNEIIEGLDSKAQPEPQAGDVWWNGKYAIFVNDKGGELTYTYADRGTAHMGLKRIIDFYTYTRIFSLSEYLKEAESV